MAAMRRVVLVAGRIGGVGGVQRLTRAYAKGLRSGGWNVTIVHMDRPAVEGAAPWSVGLSLAAGISGLKSLIKANFSRATLVVLPDTRARLCALTLAPLCRKLFVFDSVRFSSIPPCSARKILTWLVENIVLRFFDVIATYEEVARRVERTEGSCVGVLYNPVVEANQAPRAKMRKRKVLVYMGRLEHEKGADLLPNIFEALVECQVGGSHGFDLEIWGEGSIKAQIVNYHPSSSDCSFKVMGGTDEPLKVIGNADVVLLPSRSEGPSLTCAEAVCYGVPVVFFKVDGNGPGEVAGIGGSAVEQGDIAAFAKAVASVSGMPSVARDEISEVSRRRFSEVVFSRELNRIISNGG